MPFSEHCYKLFLNRKLYLATVKLQADLGLGRSYSVMLPFVEGLHSMGYLGDADYEVYKARYSVSLEQEAEIPTWKREKKVETKENKDRQLNRHYSEVLKQWSKLSSEAQTIHLKKAEEHKRLKSARLLKSGFGIIKLLCGSQMRKLRFRLPIFFDSC